MSLATPPTVAAPPGASLHVRGGILLLPVSFAIGAGDGAGCGWTLILAVAAAAAIWWWDYRLRLREDAERRNRELYELSEFTVVDQMRGHPDFELYCARILPAMSYNGRGPRSTRTSRARLSMVVRWGLTTSPCGAWSVHSTIPLSIGITLARLERPSPTARSPWPVRMGHPASRSGIQPDFAITNAKGELFTVKLWMKDRELGEDAVRALHWIFVHHMSDICPGATPLVVDVRRKKIYRFNRRPWKGGFEALLENEAASLAGLWEKLAAA